MPHKHHSSAKPPRTSRAVRGAITGLAAARMGLAQVGHRIAPGAQDAHEAALGRILFGALGQLRGTALKVSQLLSMHPDLLPEGMRRELARAHHQAVPLNRALVGRVFRQAFGQEPEALYDHFEPHAFAAASLGQVHRACLPSHGDVAVKVQYPCIAGTIAADMQLVRAALAALARTSVPLPPAAVVASVVDGIEATLLREVDYLQEAAQLDWFAAHAALPGVVIARPVHSHTRAQVLTQQYLPGLHIDAWLATNPPRAQRDHAGQVLWDWFMHCAFTLGRVHADPHPGNFLLLPGGDVGVLDFGCTCALSPGFRAAVAQAWSALLLQPSPPRDAQVLGAYRALGLAAPQVTQVQYSAEVAPALAQMQAWQIEPFMQPVFDFSAKKPPPVTPQHHQRVVSQHLVHVPPEMPSFERMWMGLMHLLTLLGARVKTTNPWIQPPVA